MSLRRNSYKLLAAFVLAFVCLNVGGAFCLTACTQLFASEIVAESDAHLSDHCKQAKRAAEERDRDSTKLEAGEASCCMMPVAMFAVPVEKKADFYGVHLVASMPATYESEFPGPSFYSSGLSPAPVYRPPPLDRRHDRILHSVFRN